MKILLTGKNGQIGFELRTQLTHLGKVYATGREMMDLSNPDQIRSVIRKINPDLIVNAAGYTAVDQAEEEPELATAINASAPEVLAEETKRSAAFLIHYSTDYIFDGKKNSGPYIEEDTPSPLSIYGQSKLAGEEAIRRTRGHHLIFRTSWVYGLRGKNFLLTIRRLAKERKELRVVNDQSGSPTWSHFAARVTAQILSKLFDPKLKNSQMNPADVSGTYHLTCSGQTSWYGFAEEILNSLSLSSRPQLIPISSSEFSAPAKRPGFSVLSCQKIEKVFGIKMTPWEEALKQCLSKGSY